MSKGVLRVGLAVAGVALALVPGAQAFATATLSSALGGTALATSIASAATGFLAAAGLQAAQSLIGGSKPPPVTGSVTQTIIDPNAPQPYVMGEGYVAGVERYRRTWGGTVDKVPNPYLGMLHVYSGGGPVQSLTPYVDQAAVAPGSWYDTWLTTTTQLGACPEAAALLPTTWTGAPDRDSNSKLSGQAAMFWTLRYDKDGKRFASGVPQVGAYGKWVKVYDPRKDSTRSGGSGSHRIGVESTYEWSENPALHAAQYAFGRYQNGKRVIGMGIPDTAIDWPVVAAWANTCDANGWTIFGRVFEPGDRNQNLDDICAAGGGAPVKAGGMLSFHYWTPRVALDTVTEADLGEDAASVVAMAPWRDRINTIVPKYRGQGDQNWEMVDARTVSVASYVTEDGEEKARSWPWNMVKSAAQASQLSRYKIEDMRELQPIVLNCGPRLRAYRPGECLQLNIPRLGLNTKAVIIKRKRDPARGTITFTFMGETDAKHAFALGQTYTAPPTPALAQTGQARDTLFDTVFETSRVTGKVTIGGNPPAAALSAFGDTHIADDGTIYNRVNDGGILLGGYAITLAGYRPQLAWTPAPSQPLRDTIAKAGEAYIDANAAIDDLADLANDGVLTINEKVTKLIPDSLRLEDKWSALYALAGTLGVSTASASAARSAWLSYLAGLSPAWNNTAADTPVVRTAYNTARDSYDAALYALDQAIKNSAATTAVWANISGAGKAADNATRNVVTYAATAPGLPVDGDLWVDTSGTFAVFKLRSGGAWVTGANALSAYNTLSGRPVALADINTTESTKLSGIATGATRNVVTYSATAPGGPVDGDLWVDTSGTYAVFKLRSGGAWVTGANALSAYNALSGRPVALADINTTESTKLSGIAAGATVGAPTGTPVGSITAGDVSSTINSGGGVANNQVSTPSILANAVTVFAPSFSDVPVTLTSSPTPAALSYTTLRSTSYTSVGSPVFLLMVLHIHAGSGSTNVCSMSLRLKVNGTVLKTFTPSYAGSNTVSITHAFFDTPSAGSVTYEIEAAAWPQLNNVVVDDAAILPIELKK